MRLTRNVLLSTNARCHPYTLQDQFQKSIQCSPWDTNRIVMYKEAMSTIQSILNVAMERNKALILHGCTTRCCQQCFVLNLCHQEPMKGLRSSSKLPYFELIWIFLTHSHKVPSIKPHKNPPSGNWIDTCGQIKSTATMTLIDVTQRT
jgi:hypothetical protein